ncbi:AraC family transcriptional regulator [Chromatiaceae bacterium AAb-1]|nr:AraC family transcriptional regulator [Chromatiaceae bacterium AAb-1]
MSNLHLSAPDIRLLPERSDLELCRMQLIQQLMQIIPGNSVVNTAIPCLNLFRMAATTGSMPVIYNPTLCLMLQGAKQIWLGNECINYTPLNYLLAPVTVPVTGKIVQASAEKPYLGLSIDIDIKELADMVIELGPKVGCTTEQARGLHIGTVDLPLLSAVQRLVKLLQTPDDIPVLMPLIRREILYRLLQGELGAQLRNFTRQDTQAHRIARVIELLHQRFHEPLRIKDLANIVHLSESALFQSFKAVTSMSPLQFQKKLRLNEARRIMLYEGMEAATASYKVGYESPSQFSREYSRLFGAPPKTDIARFRQSA